MKDFITPIQGCPEYSIKLYCRENHEELIYAIFCQDVFNGSNGRQELDKSPVFRIVGSSLNEVRVAFKGISEDDIWNIVARGWCPENDKFIIE